ncbi:MAG: nuclear transport factor 2 family protein [Cellvibrionaceae bacterium]
MDQLVVQFKSFYRDLVNLPGNQFGQIYADDVIFRDPIIRIRGGADLLSYVEPLGKAISYGRIEYLDELVNANSAYIKWNLNFRHPKFGDRMMTMRGMTHIQFDQKIHYHEDIYDASSILYEPLPLLGPVTRWLKSRLRKGVR